MKQTETNGASTVDPVVHTPRGSKTPRAYVSIGVSGRKPTWVRADVARVILDSPDVVRDALQTAESEITPSEPADNGAVPNDAAALLAALKDLGIDPAKLGAAAANGNGNGSSAQVSSSKPAPTAKKSPLADRVASRARR